MGASQSKSSDASATQTADPPADMIETKALIPAESPPYETPLDLRYPLHWYPNKWFDGRQRRETFQTTVFPCGLRKHSEDYEKQSTEHEKQSRQADLIRDCSCTPDDEKTARGYICVCRREWPDYPCTCSEVSKALGAAHDALEKEEDWPENVYLSIGKAVNLQQHSGESPEFFEVCLWWSDRRPSWRDAHKIVVRTIQQHFGKIEEYRNLPIRYTEIESRDEGF